MYPRAYATNATLQNSLVPLEIGSEEHQLLDHCTYHFTGDNLHHISFTSIITIGFLTLGGSPAPSQTEESKEGGAVWRQLRVT